MSYRLAIVGDQPSRSESEIEGLLLPSSGFHHFRIQRDSHALTTIQDFKPDLILAMAAGEREQSLGVLQLLSDWNLHVPALAVIASEAGGEVLRVAAKVVDDFVLWPLRAGELQRRASRLIGLDSGDLDQVSEQLARELSLSKLIGKDPAFLAVIRQIPLLARSDAPVLLLGETGTGKESGARALHHLSPRNGHPFIPVDCGALPEHLAENELFGHVRGAFTGALAEQRGLAAMAEGGTMFLDEVDSLSLPVQAKLLRFLEDGTYRALGADRFKRANVRVLAASNRDLEACVYERSFRQDLYFRLNVLQLRLPALRDRKQDIPLLARYRLESLCRRYANHKTFSTAALRTLEYHHWPGNVRELFNVVERAEVLAPGSQILPHHLTLSLPLEDAPGAEGSFREGKLKAVAAFERLYIEQMLRKHKGNITQAARDARQDRRAFGRLVKKHAVDRTAL